MIAPGIAAQDAVEIVASGLFDADWYRRMNPDVAAIDVDPLTHFMTQGWREMRSPGPQFDLAWYARRYAEDIDADVNPLVHYLQHGWRAGNWPSGTFDPAAFLKENEDLAWIEVEPLQLAEISSKRPSIDIRARDASRAPAWHASDLQERAYIPATSPPAATPIQVIAHYLPQFHTTPENDEWWGRGFTEWTNVRRGQPRFEGHEQPHVPLGLDYYNLDTVGVLRRQAKMAANHGVTAFAFYSYWFSGRRLLNKPLDDFARDAEIDLGFCVIWANESWTRAWDGDAGEILIEQTYSPHDDLAFIAAHSQYLQDPRYVRVGGRPLLAIYRPEALPDPIGTTSRWREWCRASGIGEIHLVAVQSHERCNPIELGFDAAMEFWPNQANTTEITSAVAGESYEGRIYDWTELVIRSQHYHSIPYPLYRGTCVSWDSEARRPGWGTTMHGATPDLFRQWLSNAATESVDRIDDPSQRVIFVNAWNEWAEGCHLEPDERYGYQWLHAVRDVQDSLLASPRLLARVDDEAAPSGGDSLHPIADGVVVVAHDMHRHGAQLGALALARTLLDLGRTCEVVALGPGSLEADFGELTLLHRADREEVGRARALAESLLSRGFSTALVNSFAGEWFAEILRETGLYVVLLIHELPSIIQRTGLARADWNVELACNELVFPSLEVWRQFPFSTEGVEARTLPQGLYRTELLQVPLDAAAETKLRMGLDPNIPLAISVGYGDYRKGFDRFVDVANAAHIAGIPMVFAWVGQIDEHDVALSAHRELARNLQNVIIQGFETELDGWYSAADVHLLLSREDPFPSVVLEAAACGLPSIVISGATGIEKCVIELRGTVAAGSQTSELLRLVIAMTGGASALTSASRQEMRQYVIHDHNHRSYVLDLLASTPAAIPRVSVIVPSYQHEAFVADRLASILSQNFPIYEVVLIDDASDDRTFEVALQSLQGANVAWHAEQGRTNRGLVWWQWRAGLDRARGDIVWIAESDDVAEPDFLSTLVPEFTRVDTVLAFSQCQPVGADGQSLGSDYRDYLHAMLPEVDWHANVRFATDDFGQTASSILNPIFTVSSTLARREVLTSAIDELGTQLLGHPTTGDWLIYRTIGQMGEVAYVPHVLCLQRRHDTSVISKTDREIHLREIEAMHALIGERHHDAHGDWIERTAQYRASLREVSA